MPPDPDTTAPAATPASDVCQLTQPQLLDIIRLVEDPDIGISIVDLGLVYEVRNLAGQIEVDMTLTSAGCPYGPQLVAEVECVVRSIKGVRGVKVTIVWDPPWSLDKVSEDVKLELGL